MLSAYDQTECFMTRLNAYDQTQCLCSDSMLSAYGQTQYL